MYRSEAQANEALHAGIKSVSSWGTPSKRVRKLGLFARLIRALTL